MFDLIIEEASNRFNLGDKALPLTQMLVSAMINPDTQGLSGFIGRFKNNGLDYLVHSWLQADAPLRINHAQIENVLGGKGGVLETVTTQLGLDKGSALLGLAYLLPKLFGQLAPAGNISDTVNDDIKSFAQQRLSLTGGVTATAATATPNHDTLASIVETIGHRFNLGDKAEPLVQSVVAAMTENATGGLTGFIDSLKKQGLSGLVDSWLHGSAPLNINHAQIENALGAKDGLLATITDKVGLDKGNALMGLSYLLPKLLHRLAPAGDVTAADSPEVSHFAEKGLALLGIGAAVAGNQSAPIPVSAPAPVPEPIPVPAPVPVPEPIPVSAPVPVPAPIPIPAPAPVPTPAASVKPATPMPSETKEGRPFWKNLFWILPIVLGLLALKTCSHGAEDTVDNNADTASSSTSNAVSGTENDQKTAEKAITEKGDTAPVAAKSQAVPAVESKPVSAATAKTSTNKPSEAAKSTTDAVMQAIPSAKLYFDVDKTVLPSDTADKLAPVLKYLKAHGDAKVSIAGFHDPSGNQAANEKLAKNRAKQVAGRLKAAGIAEKTIVMQKPQSTTGTGTKEEARRVEVTISQ